MHCMTLSRAVGAVTFICAVTLSQVAVAGSTDTDLSAAAVSAAGTADLSLPTDPNASGDSSFPTTVDSSGDVDPTNLPAALSGDSSFPSTIVSDDAQMTAAPTDSPLPQATGGADDPNAQSDDSAPGVPIWADLQVEDTESMTDSSVASATASTAAAAAAIANADGSSLRRRNLLAARYKQYELHCGGPGMNHAMRTCGSTTPPITGNLCQATCYCTVNGCIKCNNEGLGYCSMAVMQATCATPNNSFTCACRVKGTDHTDAMAVMCNDPQ